MLFVIATTNIISATPPPILDSSLSLPPSLPFFSGTDDLVINGSKMWITNGMQADWMCLLANTSEGDPHRNKSLICLPMDSKGISTAKIKKIGQNSSDTAQVFFENVRVPRKNIIGEEGKGFTYQMLQFQEERMWGVASG